MSDTIYILGAGFSKCDGAPLQNDILKEIFNPEFRSLNFSSDVFYEQRRKLNDFLYSLFSVNNYDDLSKINLEDLLTILDKAILNREFIRNYSYEYLVDIRSALNKCIIFLFNEKLSSSSSLFYKNLADKIIEEKLSKEQTEDSIGFIYLNWDIILDNYIFSSAENNNFLEEALLTKYPDSKPKYVHLDYCCYTTPFEMPNYSLLKYNLKSIDVKAKGFYNIKIQKLHGSLNWLTCNNCGRLFYKLDAKIAMYELYDTLTCPVCNTESLHSFIITPTLLKDLNNTHIKMIWHNALMDLTEAKKIVFVGYSFPLADFDLKYLFKKGIRTTADIEIVLTDSARSQEAFDRYKKFFGNQINKPLITDGSQNYFAREFGFNHIPNDCKDNLT